MLLVTLLHAGVALGLTCSDYADPAEQGQVEDSPVNESSGLAYGRDRQGVWYTHNDSGGQPELYAFELDGTYIGAHAVEGVPFADWEALSWGPCPDGSSCLYIGDVGDNGQARPYVSVYAVREPAEGEPAELVGTWNASYPEGAAQNSEALMVHPRTGRIDLVTKVNADSSGVYRFPAAATWDAIGELELIATVAISGKGGSLSVTGSDWDPDGDRVVIRTYSAAYQWSADPCEPDAHWGDEPLSWYTSDGQGEAIAFNGIGDLVTSSEGNPMVLKRLVCAEPGDGSGPCDTGGPLDSAEDDAPGTGPPHWDDERGCGCGGGGTTGIALLVVFVPLALRRRGGGGAVAGLRGSTTSPT